jgi:hypothetical protein
MRIEATSIAGASNASARSMACMSSVTELPSKAPLVGPCPQCELADTVLHEVPADREKAGI